VAKPRPFGGYFWWATPEVSSPPEVSSQATPRQRSKGMQSRKQ